MIAKYSLNQLFLGSILFVLFLSGAASYGQISGGQIEEKKTDKKKSNASDIDFDTDSLTGSVYYFTGLIQRTFRDFTDNSPYKIHAPLNEQVPSIGSGFTLGILMPISSRLSLDMGVSYFTNAEAYSFTSEMNDSTFDYKNKYVQVGIPLKLRYTTGKKVQFFGFAGVTPLNIFSVRYLSNYTTSTGIEYEQDPVVDRQDFVSFNVMASAGIGFNYYFKNLGLTIYPEYRRHLFNTYANDTFKREHFMYGFGLNFGLMLRV
jgi:hypothetical protein